MLTDISYIEEYIKQRPSYLDLTYTDYSLISTHVWEPIHIPIENDSLIRKFNYLNSHLGNRGAWISECAVYQNLQNPNN